VIARAKTLARFKQLDDRDFAEYYLPRNAGQRRGRDRSARSPLAAAIGFARLSAAIQPRLTVLPVAGCRCDRRIRHRDPGRSPFAVLIIELGVRRGLRLAGGGRAGRRDGRRALRAAGRARRRPGSRSCSARSTPALQAVAGRRSCSGSRSAACNLALYHARIGIPGNAELPGQPLRTYLRFLAITLLNPTTILYFAALILGRPELGETPGERAAFIAGAALASTSWQLLLACLGALAHQRLSSRAQLAISLLGNAVVAGLRS
jgi:hypothetical protein